MRVIERSKIKFVKRKEKKEGFLEFLPDCFQEKRKISTKFQEGDELVFEFKEISSKEVALLFSVIRGRKRIKFNGDEKFFLGIFPDKPSAMIMAYRIFYFLQEIFETKTKRKIELKSGTLEIRQIYDLR